jgi:hypothetical protein
MRRSLATPPVGSLSYLVITSRQMLAESDPLASDVTTPFQNFIDAPLIHAECLRDVMLLLAKKVTLPHFDRVFERELRGRSPHRVGIHLN